MLHRSQRLLSDKMKLLSFVLLVAFAATQINAVSYEVINDEWEAWKAFHGKIAQISYRHNIFVLLCELL